MLTAIPIPGAGDDAGIDRMTAVKATRATVGNETRTHVFSAGVAPTSPRPLAAGPAVGGR